MVVFILGSCFSLRPSHTSRFPFPDPEDLSLASMWDCFLMEDLLCSLPDVPLLSDSEWLFSLTGRDSLVHPLGCLALPPGTASLRLWESPVATVFEVLISSSSPKPNPLVVSWGTNGPWKARSEGPGASWLRFLSYLSKIILYL